MENNTEFVNDEVTDVVEATDVVVSDGRGMSAGKFVVGTAIIGGAAYGVYRLGKFIVRKIRERRLKDAQNFSHEDADNAEAVDEAE